MPRIFSTKQVSGKSFIGRIFIYFFLSITIIAVGLSVLTWNYIEQKRLADLSYTSEIIKSYYELAFRQWELTLLSVGHRISEINGPQKEEERLRYLIKSKSVYKELLAFGYADTTGLVTLLTGSDARDSLPNLQQSEKTKRSFLLAKKSNRLVIGECYYFQNVKDWILPMRVSIRDANGDLIAVNTTAMDFRSIESDLANFNFDKQYEVHLINNYFDITQFYHPLDRQKYEEVLGSNASIYSDLKILSSVPEKKSIQFLSFNKYSGYEVIGVRTTLEHWNHDLVVMMKYSLVWDQFLVQGKLIGSTYVLIIVLSTLFFAYFRKKQLEYIVQIQDSKNMLLTFNENLEKTIGERTLKLNSTVEELHATNENLNQSNKNLNKAYSQLKELDQYKESMTAMIVHDFKNSLNTVISFSEGTPTERRLRSIRQAGQFMLNMVLNILDLQKFESASVKMSLANYTVNKLVNEAVDQLSYLMEQKAIKLNFEPTGQLYCRVDHDLTVRVIVNILSNAIKYVPQNGKIDILATRQNDFVQIAIRDNGIGIPADKIHMIFEKYVQIDAQKSGSVRSTGIGLTFCKMVVENLGGSIGAESEEGKGSTFYFTLPFVNEDLSQAQPVAPVVLLNEQDIVLSDDEQATLKPWLEKLRQWEVYDYSEITAIMKQIDGNSNIALWKEQVMKAVQTGNEGQFSKLLINRK